MIVVRSCSLASSSLADVCPDFVSRYYDPGLQPLFFYGHHPKVDGIIDRAVFSQWASVVFSYNGDVYNCAEQWMMRHKAVCFGDKASEAAIMRSRSPKTHKAKGKKVTGFDPIVWASKADAVVRMGNYLKFSQNPALQAFLLSSYPRMLVEASPDDTEWGIGMRESEARKLRPSAWRGKNRLGLALMATREWLRTGTAPPPWKFIPSKIEASVKSYFEKRGRKRKITDK